jgi:hypothetical protein
MKEFKSDKYLAAVTHNGLLTVTNGPPVLHKTTYKNGVESQEEVNLENVTDSVDRRLLEYRRSAPVFEATWAGHCQWNVDLDCGFQRYNGIKTNGEVKKALKNCHFDKEQIDEIVALCKKAKWDYCPRNG